MKTKEFVKHVEKLGLKVGDWLSGKGICVEDEDDTIYAFVREDVSGVLDNDCEGKNFLTDENKEILFNLLVEYASTPIEERKEEKKYCIRHKYLDSIFNYLNYDEDDKSWTFGNQRQILDYKSQFTLAELPDWVKEMLEQGHLVKEEVE